MAGLGAIATYTIASQLYYIATCDQLDMEEMEKDLLRHCTVDLGASDAVVRVVGFRNFIAVAQNLDTGEFGSGSEDTREEAENVAVSIAGDSRSSWIFSSHSESLNDHGHFIGECPG